MSNVVSTIALICGGCALFEGRGLGVWRLLGPLPSSDPARFFWEWRFLSLPQPQVSGPGPSAEASLGVPLQHGSDPPDERSDGVRLLPCLPRGFVITIPSVFPEDTCIRQKSNFTQL